MNRKNLKQWLKAAGIRTIKTMAETALAIIGTNAIGITEVDWLGVISAVALSGVVTLLSCVKGLPEVDSATTAELTEQEKIKLDRDRKEYENFMTYNGDEQ